LRLSGPFLVDPPNWIVWRSWRITSVRHACLGVNERRSPERRVKTLSDAV